MVRHNYLVSVFEDGKNVNLYFLDNLYEIIIIKARHKDCEIGIFDIDNCVRFTPSQVEREIIKAGKHWKKSLH